MQKLSRREMLKLSVAAPLGAAALPSAVPVSGEKLRLSEAAEPWLEINFANMAWNLAQIRKLVQNRPVMAVIKANGYGHGLVETAKFLETQNISALAVGKVSEALRLREAGIRAPILNFGAFSASQAAELVRRNITQTTYTDDFRLLAEAARRQGVSARVQIKIDTGLGRVGVPAHRALPLLENIAGTAGLNITGMYTTFTEEADFDRVQLQRLLEVCEAAKQRGIEAGRRHAASSAAVLAFAEGHLDMVRPGIMLYGEYPSTEEYKTRRVTLRPVATLKSRVMYLKTLRPGDTVSYHRAFIARKPTRVATISIGYSDGYPYQAAKQAEVLIRGRRFPAIGLITANHLTAEVSGAEEIRIGDEVVLLGQQGEERITCEELAAWGGTSVYKILIWLNPFLPRTVRRS